MYLSQVEWHPTNRSLQSLHEMVSDDGYFSNKCDKLSLLNQITPMFESMMILKVYLMPFDRRSDKFLAASLYRLSDMIVLLPITIVTSGYSLQFNRV